MFGFNRKARKVQVASVRFCDGDVTPVRTATDRSNAIRERAQYQAAYNGLKL
jgi:hypothetical protein